MRLTQVLTAATAALSLLAGCGGAPENATPGGAGQTQQAMTPGGGPVRSTLDEDFERAGAEFQVPASLLKAISFAETRFQMVVGQEEFAGLAPAYGVMALRGERLALGAKLAGISEEEARTDARSNIRAGAALLSAYAEELRVERAELGAWAPAVARFSGIADPEAQASYVHGDVYKALGEGVVVETAQGPLASLMPEPGVKADFPAPSMALQSADYASAVWRPSPNYNSRPAGSTGTIAMIVIHDCEGSYASCWSWLDNSAAQASAHYVVNESGSEISQLVLESNRAWHVAATYDCSLNSSVDCSRNGNSVNNFAVGIEHGGFASQTSWPTGQIDASAKLSCNIAKAHAITPDRYHIIGHGQLQPYDRTDPGPNWPWTDYLNRVNNYCGGSSLIVDSNNSNNDTAQGYIETSANWTSSTNVAGYYGTGYFYANTAAVSDPATFYFYLPAAATKTIDAWWTAGTDRSTTAPWIVYNASGTKLATINTNQQINGGQWNALGAYAFTAGWNKVQLSRWTAAGSVVIADAIRVR